MSILSEINRIKGNITSAYSAISSKGGTLPSNQNSENLATAIESIISGGGLPSGIAAIATGTYTVASDFTTSKKTINHDLGVVPDMVLFWYPNGNIATTYSMLYSLRSTKMGFRSSAYNVFNGYHGNSTSTVTTSNSNGTGIGVSNFTSTTFQLASHSTSYYWRGGYTYKWLAIKFS